MSGVTIWQKGAARRKSDQLSPGEAPRRGLGGLGGTGGTEGPGGMRAGVGRVRFGPQRALPKRAPSEPSAPAPLHRACPSSPSPLTVSPRLKTVLPSFRAIQPAGWPPHSTLALRDSAKHPASRALAMLLHFTAPPAPAPAATCQCLAC